MKQPHQTVIESAFEIDAAIAWHDGDTRATIAALLEDRQHLREQLAMAFNALSRGPVRGWTPTFDRS
ncbi:hypothetical protein CPY51_28180 [Rhizobium tubonense]|uniref:Dehydrogenase n=1 Tax=Rhizobium tubonense TaxID=484088 RepID=A0A2W4CDH4_9HYPH|nr:hypothetical protein CPY51_28180 [Rhizobium tubonense]